MEENLTQEERLRQIVAEYPDYASLHLRMNLNVYKDVYCYLLAESGVQGYYCQPLSLKPERIDSAKAIKTMVDKYGATGINSIFTFYEKLGLYSSRDLRAIACALAAAYKQLSKEIKKDKSITDFIEFIKQFRADPYFLAAVFRITGSRDYLNYLVQGSYAKAVDVFYVLSLFEVEKSFSSACNCLGTQLEYFIDHRRTMPVEYNLGCYCWLIDRFLQCDPDSFTEDVRKLLKCLSHLVKSACTVSRIKSLGKHNFEPDEIAFMNYRMQFMSTSREKAFNDATKMKKLIINSFGILIGSKRFHECAEEILENNKYVGTGYNSDTLLNAVSDEYDALWDFDWSYNLLKKAYGSIASAFNHRVFRFDPIYKDYLFEVLDAEDKLACIAGNFKNADSMKALNLVRLLREQGLLESFLNSKYLTKDALKAIMSTGVVKGIYTEGNDKYFSVLMEVILPMETKADYDLLLQFVEEKGKADAFSIFDSYLGKIVNRYRWRPADFAAYVPYNKEFLQNDQRFNLIHLFLEYYAVRQANYFTKVLVSLCKDSNVYCILGKEEVIECYEYLVEHDEFRSSDEQDEVAELLGLKEHNEVETADELDEAEEVID